MRTEWPVFQPGDIVECVDKSGAGDRIQSAPVLYTVESFLHDPDGEHTVDLVPCDGLKIADGWNSKRFKLVHRPTCQTQTEPSQPAET